MLLKTDDQTFLHICPLRDNMWTIANSSWQRITKWDRSGRYTWYKGRPVRTLWS